MQEAEMKKRAYLIHGYEGRPEHGWRPWLKTELEKHGFEVTVPAMPNPDYPVMDEWVGHISKVVGKCDSGCFFVGHSLGCIAIMRYFEGLPSSQKAGGAVMVAGFSDYLGMKPLQSFFTTEINWEKLKASCRKFVAIHSDNDPYVPLKHADIFKEKLGAKIIIERGRGHFSGSEGTTRVDSVLESLLEMSSNQK